MYAPLTWTGDTATKGTDFSGKLAADFAALFQIIWKGSLNIVFDIDDDSLVEEDETFTVTLTPPAGWAAHPHATATVTIQDDERAGAKIAFGSNASGENAYAATVFENVSGGSLNVPVTVSHLPGASTTFDVEVVTGGSAVEGTDYSIATKSVQFGPSDTGKSKNLAIAITDDTDVEGDETIRLRIAAADDPGDDLGDHYARHASSSTATVTIDSEDMLLPTFSPANGETETDAGANITLTFSEAIRKDDSGTDFVNSDLSSILTLRETNSSGATINYAATINTAKTVITIDPSANLADGKVYVAISNAYYDGNGNQGSQASATFTVAATPVQSSDADLSGLRVSTHNGFRGTFTPLALTPSTFSASTTSYTATVPYEAKYLKLTPVLADTAKATDCGRLVPLCRCAVPRHAVRQPHGRCNEPPWVTAWPLAGLDSQSGYLG